MRVIGGQNRGLRLARPRGSEVRPILDRVRESLFGILRHEVPGARVADLFAGTGVIGIEALSRGAEFCVFVERDPLCIRTIVENLRRARLEGRSRVIRADALRAAGLVEENGACGLIFVDPPYRLLRGERSQERVHRLVAELGEQGVLAEGGMVVLRYPEEVHVPAHIGALTQTDRRRYGRMRIAFFRRT